jgi:hypothetical protein
MTLPATVLRNLVKIVRNAVQAGAKKSAPTAEINQPGDRCSRLWKLTNRFSPTPLVEDIISDRRRLAAFE